MGGSAGEGAAAAATVPEKDPKRRLRDIGDAMALLEEAPQSAPGAPSARRAAWMWPSAAALLVVALASLAVVHYREQPPAPPEPTRFQILLPDKVTLTAAGGFSVSPDGRQLVFAAAGSDNVTRLWVRALDSLEAHPLAGTGNQRDPSPDVLVARQPVRGLRRRREAQENRPHGRAGANVVGYSCADRGRIVEPRWRDHFALGNGGLMRVPAAGGVASPLTALDPSRRETTHLFPSFLPDGRHFLYLRFSNTLQGVAFTWDSRGQTRGTELQTVAPDDVWACSLRAPSGFGFRVNSRTTTVPARGDAHGATF